MLLQMKQQDFRDIKTGNDNTTWQFSYTTKHVTKSNVKIRGRNN